MDPNLNTTPPPLQPPVRPKVSRKMLFIIGGVIFVVVAAVAILFFTKKPTPGPDTSDTKASLYVTREGYEYHSGIGDALALYSKPGAATPTEYQGTKIIQACNVLTLTELRKLGLKTEKMQLTTGFERTYFDGEGKGILRSSYGLPIGSDSNSCRYQLEEDNGSLELLVYQEPYASVEALTAEVAKYTKRSPMGELNVYHRQDENGTQYIIGRGSTAVEVRISGLSSEEEKKLIDKIAATFTTERANPTGAPKIVFESSLIKGPYADACKLLGADSVKQVFDSEVSPIATQRYGNSVGVLTFKLDNGSQLSDNYIENDCIREIIKTEADINSFTTRKASLNTTTFMSEEGAKAEMDSTKKYNKNFDDVPGIGDGAFFTKEIADEKLYVRRGTFVLSFAFENKRANLSKEQKIQVLSELAKSALGKIK